MTRLRPNPRATPGPNRRFLTLAVGCSLVFVSWAPFAGEIRNALRAAFPAAFAPVVATTIALALVIPCALALMRIRTKRMLRAGAIALALAVVAGYWLRFRTGIAEVDAVELFHFLQYGIIGALFYRAFVPINDATVFPLAVASGFFVGTTEEWLQWLVPTRVGEARDVYLNLAAIGCGILVGVGIEPAGGSWRLRPGSRRRLSWLVAVAVLWFGTFYHLAHLGYAISDPVVGNFASRYTAEDLLALGAARRETWRRNPPTRLRPFAIEDFYLTEAAEHVQHRNGYYAAGSFFEAWRENGILERYYAPVLDLQAFSSGERHRWPAEQRAEVEAKAADAPGRPFTSPAARNRIVVRPTKAEFWTAVAVGVALLLAAAARRDTPHEDAT